MIEGHEYYFSSINIRSRFLLSQHESVITFICVHTTHSPPIHFFTNVYTHSIYLITNTKQQNHYFVTTPQHNTTQHNTTQHNTTQPSTKPTPNQERNETKQIDKEDLENLSTIDHKEEEMEQRMVSFYLKPFSMAR